METTESISEPAPEPVKKSKIVITEGIDGQAVFAELINYLGFRKKFEVRNMGGKDNMHSYIPTLATLNDFKTQVSSLCIVRDADDSPESAFQSARDALKKAELPIPDKPFSVARKKLTTMIIVLPDGIEKGELEDLLLSSVKSDASMSCIKSYFKCLKQRLKEMPRKMAKAKVQAFLASRPRPLPLRHAVRKGYFEWEEEAFDKVRDALKQL